MTTTTPTIDNHVRQLAKRLWDYHRVNAEVESADFILALGSHDERVAEYAAQLMLEDAAPLLVTSGGFGKVTSAIWKVSEGERFAEIARKAGVRSDHILVEDKASNTGENVSLTRNLLEKYGRAVTSGILVVKPYMERRSYATAAQVWPEVRWTPASPPISFESYPTAEVTERKMIELMVGDLQRIAEYPRLGFQIPQDIPPDVWNAGEELVRLGFDAFALKR